MRIGIDIDDTTFYTVKSMIKYGDIYEKLAGHAVNKNNMGLIKNRYYLNDLYGWDDKTKFDFFDKFYKNVLEECTVIPGAKDVICKLKEQGDSIHFVTARLMNIEGCDTESITRKSLEDNGIPYDSLNLHIGDKLSFFLENKLDICIEDSYDTCRELTDNGIKSILMTTKMNYAVDNKDIKRVNTWEEIYEDIEEYRKCINGKA